MTSLDSLITTISDRSSELAKLRADNGLPSLALDQGWVNSSPEPGVSTSLNKPEENKELQETRNDLLSAAVDLVRLVSGPKDHLLALSWSAADVANLGILVKFNIPQAVPLGNRIACRDLASLVGLPENILERVIRYSIALGVFCEPSLGYFGHTALSKTLASDENIRNIVLWNTDEITSIVTKLPEALKFRQQNEGSTTAGFNIAYRTDETVFEFFSKTAASRVRYHNYLAARGNLSRWSTDHILRLWNWAAIGSGTVIDVGGSYGEVCRKLAVAYPELNCIVQDISVEAIATGQEALSADLQQRIKFAQHDFFYLQPTAADVYLFRHILHDWADDDCVRILKALVPALRDRSRVLISEAIMPIPPARTLNTLDEKLVRLEDSLMMAVHNAQERSEEEYITLFKRADKNFNFVGSSHSPEAFQSLLDFEFRTK